MRSRLWAVAALAALGLGLAGCSSLAPPKKPMPIGTSTAPVGGVCDAQAAQWAVGKSATGQVIEQARVRAGARMARVLHPGQVVTLEFDAERLNLGVNATGVVISARCG